MRWSPGAEEELPNLLHQGINIVNPQNIEICDAGIIGLKRAMRYLTDVSAASYEDVGSPSR